MTSSLDEQINIKGEQTLPPSTEQAICSNPDSAVVLLAPHAIHWIKGNIIYLRHFRYCVYNSTSTLGTLLSRGSISLWLTQQQRTRKASLSS